MLRPDASIMAFGAHAADFCFRAGGTLIKYKLRGARIQVFCATFGERGESTVHWQRGITSIDEIIKIRREEAADAARTLGVDVEFLNLGDNPLRISDETLLDLSRRIAEFRPDIVLTHWTHEPTNPDHATLGNAVIQAVTISRANVTKVGREYQARRPRIFLWEPDIMSQPVLDYRPDTYVDITQEADQKFRAVACYAETQPGLSDRWPQRGMLRALEARSLCQLPGCQFAEAFKRYQPFGGDGFV